jgi:hypothetical protein
VPSGTVSVTRPANPPPAPVPAGPRPGPHRAAAAPRCRRRRRCCCCRWRPGRHAVRAGPRVLAQDQVQERAGAQLVHPALQPGLLQLPGPPADPLITRQHLIRGEFAAHQRGVAGVLGPPLHPREPRRRPPPFFCFLGCGFQDGAGQRGPQPARREPPGPVQDGCFDRAGLVIVQVVGQPDDELGLAPGDDPVPQRFERAAEPDGEVPGHGQQPVRRRPRLAQGQGQLVPGKLVHHRRHLPWFGLEPVLGVAPEHLGDRDELAGRGVGLDPVPGAHQPGQLMISHPAERVGRAGPAVHRGVCGHRQLRAPRRHVQRHPDTEPGRPARRLTGERPRRSGLPRTPPPRAGRVQRQHLISSRLGDPGQLSGSQLVLAGRRRARLRVPVLLRRVTRVVILRAQPVQPCLPLHGRHRIPVQPGGNLVPPGVRGNRFRRHVPPPVREINPCRT